MVAAWGGSAPESLKTGLLVAAGWRNHRRERAERRNFWQRAHCRRVGKERGER
jgi:hypothetical protein